MQRDDYLIRLIEQIGRVLAKVRNLLLNQPEAAEPVLEQAAQEAGYPLALLRALEPESLTVLVAGGRADAQRCLTAAELLGADWLICRHRGDEPGAADRLAKVKRLLAEAGLDSNLNRKEETQRRISALEDLIKAELTPPA